MRCSHSGAGITSFLVSSGTCVHVPLCAFEDTSVQDPEFRSVGTRKDVFTRQGQEQVWPKRKP